MDNPDNPDHPACRVYRLYDKGQCLILSHYLDTKIVSKLVELSRSSEILTMQHNEGQYIQMC